MARFIDARIPVVFSVEPGAKDAVLTFDPTWETTHPIGCACCVARGPAAQAMDRLFQGRVRGTIPWFDRLVVTADAETAVREALEDDLLTFARFRLG
jgi:hypothetical protein